MSTREWLGNALAVAQVTDWVFGGTWEADDVINITCNGKTVSVVAGSTVTNTVASTVQAALAASTILEFTEVTWTVDTATVTATGKVAGRPHSFTFATTETGGGAADAQTIDGGASSAGTDSTETAGPNDFDLTGNFQGGALPVNSDDVIIRRAVSILNGLDGVSGVTPATIKIYSAFWASGAQIGLAERRGSSNSVYNEYRNRFLQFTGGTAVDIGLGPHAGGSSILNLDFGTGTTAITVHRTPQSSDASRPALCLVINPGAASNGNLEVIAGSVGVGWYGETCKVTPKIGFRDNRDSDANVYFGPGVTFGATFEQSGGVVEINTATTVITKTGGTLTINGTGAHPTIDNQGGKLIYNSTGAPGATSISVGTGAVLDFSQDMSAKTLGTAIKAYRGATILDPHGVVASFAVELMGCRLDEVTIIRPVSETWTPS